MIYRPQYAFPPTLPGFLDEQFHYSFDGTNVPVLATPIAAGQGVENITLQLQNDAEFILRAVKVQLSTSPSNLYGTIRDPYGNFLSASPLPFAGYLTPSGSPLMGSLFVNFEAEVRAPIGGFFQLFLFNFTTGPVTPPAFTLYGVNRRDCGRMAA